MKPPRLPLWRKALAAVSGAGAMAIFLYAANVTDLSAVVDKGGLTALGQKQLALYLVFCGLLLILALAIGRRSRPPAQVQLPVEKRRLSRRTTAAAASILLLIPVTLFVGVYYLNNQRYGLVSVLVLLECMAPFFLVFEGRRPQARELVVIAVLCAISVAGRATFFMLPQFKPVMAMTIISGVALGGVLDQTIHELAIICQVKDLPEAITADISGLKLGESLRITDLKLPSGVTTELAGDVIVAIVEAPRVSGEEAAPAAEEAVAEK